MKVTILGSHLCQDTMYALMKMKDCDAIVEFCNISVDFSALKKFMKLRENQSDFQTVKENDKIGMPFFLLEDGTETHDLISVLRKLQE